MRLCELPYLFESCRGADFLGTPVSPPGLLFFTLHCTSHTKTKGKDYGVAFCQDPDCSRQHANTQTHLLSVVSVAGPRHSQCHSLRSLHPRVGRWAEHIIPPEHRHRRRPPPIAAHRAQQDHSSVVVFVVCVQFFFAGYSRRRATWQRPNGAKIKNKKHATNKQKCKQKQEI